MHARNRNGCRCNRHRMCPLCSLQIAVGGLLSPNRSKFLTCQPHESHVSAGKQMGLIRWHASCRLVERGSRRCHMTACNRLRIDHGDGSCVADYRIENGYVESRTLETGGESGTTEKRWQRLTPEQVSSHVMADTVVGQWLRRRMGAHKLIRACTQSSNGALGSSLQWSR